MMTAVRIDAAMMARLFRIIVVMGWITHAADAAGCLVPSRARRIHSACPAHRARSWVYASPPGLVLSCATFVDVDPSSPSPTHERTPNHTLGRWEARVVRRRTGPLGPKPTATTLARPTDIRQPGLRGLETGQRPARRYDGAMGTVLLAAPRGYCAGVERAVDAVERALEMHGGPGLRSQADRPQPARGARPGARRAPSSSRSSTRCPRRRSWSSPLTARRRRSTPTPRLGGLELIDATCPLVTKVHLEARRFAEDDRTILLIGHAGHEEVEGTSGQAPDRTILVQSIEEAERVEVPDPLRALLPHPDHPVGRRDRTRSWTSFAPGSRRSRAPLAKTSATQRRTARTPSRRSRAGRTSCS